MSWEESRRKEQVFRKAKTNREVILKTVEDADGNINLKFAIKDNEMSTELTLTFEEWESIINFLNKTSSTIIEEISKKSGKIVKGISIKPLTEYIKPEQAEPSMMPKAEPLKVPAAEVITEIKAEPVKVSTEEVITEIKAEPVKVSAEEVITEIKAEPVKVSAEEVITEVKAEPMSISNEKMALENKVEPVKAPATQMITEAEREMMPDEELFIKAEVPIVAEIKKKVELPEKKSDADSVSALIPEVKIEQKQEPETPIVSKSIPVDNEVFDQLVNEIQKIAPIQSPKETKPDITPISLEKKPIPIPEEAAIVEKQVDDIFSEPPKVPLIEAETQNLSIDSLDIKQVLDLLNQAQEAPKAIKPEEELIELKAEREPMLPPPAIPKIPEPSKAQLEALLTPIKQPKISLIEKLDTHPSAENEIPESSKIEAHELLEESRILLSTPPAPLPSAPKPLPPAPAPATEPMAAPPFIELPATPVSLGKDDEQLTADQKEARIISAMEEVAALMPPGPAKKFVEEMMLKRAESSDMDKPRIPKLNHSDSSESKEMQSK